MTARTKQRCGHGSLWHWLRRRFCYGLSMVVRRDDGTAITGGMRTSLICDDHLRAVIEASDSVDYGGGVVAHGRSAGSSGLFTTWVAS